MSIKPWEIISRKWDDGYRIFRLRTDRALSPRTGHDHNFYVLETSDWVNVIPLTDENEVVLVRQYRHGTGEITLEIPGGLVEGDASPENAAWRELREETGCSGRDLVNLGSVHPNPAIQNNRCHSFLARGVFPAGGLNQDPKEDIEVIVRPLSEIPLLILNGTITHSLVLAAFYRLFMEHGEVCPGGMQNFS